MKGFPGNMWSQNHSAGAGATVECWVAIKPNLKISSFVWIPLILPSLLLLESYQSCHSCWTLGSKTDFSQCVFIMSVYGTGQNHNCLWQQKILLSTFLIQSKHFSGKEASSVFFTWSKASTWKPGSKSYMCLSINCINVQKRLKYLVVNQFS